MSPMNALIANLIVQAFEGDTDALFLLADAYEDLGDCERAQRARNAELPESYESALKFFVGDMVHQAKVAGNKKFYNILKENLDNLHFITLLQRTQLGPIPTIIYKTMTAKDPLDVVGPKRRESLSRAIYGYRHPRFIYAQYRDACHIMKMYKEREGWIEAGELWERQERRGHYPYNGGKEHNNYWWLKNYEY